MKTTETKTKTDHLGLKAYQANTWYAFFQSYKEYRDNLDANSKACPGHLLGHRGSRHGQRYISPSFRGALVTKIGSIKDLVVMAAIFVVGFLGTQIYEQLGEPDAS